MSLRLRGRLVLLAALAVLAGGATAVGLSMRPEPAPWRAVAPVLEQVVGALPRVVVADLGPEAAVFDGDAYARDRILLRLRAGAPNFDAPCATPVVLEERLGFEPGLALPEPGDRTGAYRVLLLTVLEGFDAEAVLALDPGAQGGDLGRLLAFFEEHRAEVVRVEACDFGTAVVIEGRLRGWPRFVRLGV